MTYQVKIFNPFDHHHRFLSNKNKPLEFTLKSAVIFCNLYEYAEVTDSHSNEVVYIKKPLNQYNPLREYRKRLGLE